ncbi:MAG: hypothetical protein AAF849_15285 [Bacteroidota bacterium]
MQYIEIYESFNIAELQLIKHALEKEQIDFKVQNETLLQLGNVEAMGFRGAGVKVEVLDAGKAKQVLIDLGFNTNASDAEEEFELMKRFARFTDQIPLLNWFFPALRLVIFVFLATTFILFLLYILAD